MNTTANKSINAKKASAEHLFNQGLAVLKLGNLTASIKLLTSAVELSPKYSKAYLYRGIAKAKIDYSEAIKDFTIAIELYPEYAMAYNCRAAARSKLGDHKGAIEDVTKAIELKPRYASAYYGFGMIKMKLKYYIDAIEYFTKAIELKPRHASSYCQRGLARMGLEKHLDAIDDFTKALDINSGCVEAYYNRAIAREKAGYFMGALEDYKKASKLNPWKYADAYQNAQRMYTSDSLTNELLTDSESVVRPCRPLDNSDVGIEPRNTYRNNDNLDGGRNCYVIRDSGSQFGSMPSYDDYGEESGPDGSD